MKNARCGHELTGARDGIRADSVGQKLLPEIDNEYARFITFQEKFKIAIVWSFYSSLIDSLIRCLLFLVFC